LLATLVNIASVTALTAVEGINSNVGADVAALVIAEQRACTESADSVSLACDLTPAAVIRISVGIHTSATAVLKTIVALVLANAPGTNVGAVAREVADTAVVRVRSKINALVRAHELVVGTPRFFLRIQVVAAASYGGDGWKDHECDSTKDAHHGKLARLVGNHHRLLDRRGERRSDEVD